MITQPIIPRSTDALIRHVERRLHTHQQLAPFSFTLNQDLRNISAVLFLLGKDDKGELFLILNKRSQLVRQPGDLCYPGGGVTPGLDLWIAGCLDLPMSPLSRWPYRLWWRRHRRTDFSKLKLLLAVALREGVEEMRLNPFGVRFLGPLPVQPLVMNKRVIYPLVGWVNHQRRFFPNWEVDEIVRIPVRSFFEPVNYARFQINWKEADIFMEMPCFIRRDEVQSGLLWGATYRITQHFLQTVFDYTEPPVASRSTVDYQLDRNYYTGPQA